MTTEANVTTYDEIAESDRRYESVYIALTLFVGTLSALVASYIELRRRRRTRRHDTPPSTSVHGAGGRPDWMREDQVCV